MERLHFMNIIWADCTLVESEGKFALIDTGEISKEHKTLPYFEKMGIKEFEFIFITHFHRDHYQGLFKILDNYKVKKLYMKKYSGVDGDDGSGNKATNEYHELTLKDYNDLIQIAKAKGTKVFEVDESTNDIAVGKFTFKVFRKANYLNDIYEDPNSSFYHVKCLSENYTSSALFAKVNGVNVYIGGDLTDAEHKESSIAYANTKVIDEIGEEIDIFKVSHHATSGSQTLETLKKMKPKHCVITNSYYYLERWSTLKDILEANPKCKIFTTEKKYIVYTIHDDGNISYDLKTIDEV